MNETNSQYHSLLRDYSYDLILSLILAELWMTCVRGSHRNTPVVELPLEPFFFSGLAVLTVLDALAGYALLAGLAGLAGLAAFASLPF